MSRILLSFYLFVTILAAQNNPAPPSDASYRELRNTAPQSSYVVENIELKRDVGTLTLKKGTVTCTAPVMNRVTSAVFSGEGHFHLKSAQALELTNLIRMNGKPEVDED